MLTPSLKSMSAMERLYVLVLIHVCRILMHVCQIDNIAFTYNLDSGESVMRSHGGTGGALTTIVLGRLYLSLYRHSRETDIIYQPMTPLLVFPVRRGCTPPTTSPM